MSVRFSDVSEHFMRQWGGGDPETISDLHKGAMESGIKATDISPIAAHLTNSSMAVAGGGSPYGRTNIGWVSVGEPMQNHLTTGSLEFLKKNSLYDLFSDLGGSAGGMEDTNVPIAVSDSSLDYMAMNPPYSRTRGGQSAFDVAGLSEKQRKACQARWGSLLKNEDAIKTAGMAASFLCLAKKKVKPRGRIGFVLPLTAAFAEAWAITRNMVVKEFEDVVAIAVAGGKGGDEALSAETNMGEMLLVGTRRRKKGKAKPIHCVTLHRLPMRQGESGEFGRSIQNTLEIMRASGHPIMAGEEELGQIALFDAQGGEPWSHLGVSSATLSIAALQIADEGLLPDIINHGEDMKFNVPMTIMDEHFNVGPTHDLIGHPEGGDRRGAFVFNPITRKAEARYGVRSLWSADASIQNKLAVKPTHKGTKWSDDTSRMLLTRGTLHYARGMRWTSQALLAGTTPSRVLGGRAWTTLNHKDKHVRKAFALWANSTMGLITHWTKAGRTQLGRGSTQVGAIQEMPCPSLESLDDDVLSWVAGQFDELSDKELKPACQAHCDCTRKEIDKIVIRMLRLPKHRAFSNIVALRELWCAEPTVHGDNQKALKLLRENDLLD